MQDKRFTTSNSGIFISLEGIEGSGKSTQIKFLKEYFEQQGRKVSIYREPGGTKFGENLRKTILESTEKLTPITEAYLFASGRAQLLQEEITTKLNCNEVVLLDRYIHSSIAYQGFGRDLGSENILTIHQIPPLNLIPHITFYLEISLETSIKRQDKRGNKKDYFESENINFYKKVIKGFEFCTDYFGEQFKKIDAELTEQEVKKQILKELELNKWHQ